MAGIFCFWLIKKEHRKINAPSTPSVTTDGINYAPPTAEDKKNVEQNKENIVANEQNRESGSSNSSRKNVKPTITYADQYGQSVEVGAFVSGIFEDGGTCKAIFTHDGSSFSKNVQAVKNANSVNCPVMSAGVSEFSQKGTWSVTVSYDSPTASGASDAHQVEVK